LLTINGHETVKVTENENILGLKELKLLITLLLFSAPCYTLTLLRFSYAMAKNIAPDSLRTTKFLACGDTCTCAIMDLAASFFFTAYLSSCSLVHMAT